MITRESVNILQLKQLIKNITQIKPGGGEGKGDGENTKCTHHRDVLYA